MSKQETFCTSAPLHDAAARAEINVHTVDRQLNVHKSDRQLNVHKNMCDALCSKSVLNAMEIDCDRIPLHFQYKSQGITHVATTILFPL